jgi:hypothetical protein
VEILELVRQTAGKLPAEETESPADGLEDPDVVLAELKSLRERLRSWFRTMRQEAEIPVPGAPPIARPRCRDRALGWRGGRLAARRSSPTSRRDV